MASLKRHADGGRGGLLITFEGGDGAGKSTHIRFLAEALTAQGRDVVRLREPGGTSVGEALRSIVLDPANDSLCDEAELLIYEAARAQLVAQVIKPALERGSVVLCDRFADSSLAYQAYGRGIDVGIVERMNAYACQGVVPDRTIVLVAGTAAQGLARATRRAGADRLESAGEDFHARVNEAFVRLAQDDPARIRVVESRDTKSATSRAVFSQLADLFPWMDEALRDEGYFASLDAPRKA